MVISRRENCGGAQAAANFTGCRQDLVTASCKTEAILGRRYQKPDMPVGTWQTEVASEIKTI